MLQTQNGQATVEYILILAFVLIVGFKIASTFTNFFRDSMGSVGHALTMNVTIGVCPQQCYFEGYVNGFTGTSP